MTITRHSQQLSHGDFNKGLRDVSASYQLKISISDSSPTRNRESITLPSCSAAIIFQPDLVAADGHMIGYHDHNTFTVDLNLPNDDQFNGR